MTDATRTAWLAVALLLAVLIVDGLDLQLLSLLAPVILQEWGIDRADFGPAMSAAMIGMSAGAALGGWLGDRMSPRRVLLASTVLFGAATASAALVDGLWSLAALRVVAGFGFGAAAPNAIALATAWTPARHRHRVVSLLSVGTPLGGLLGALLLIGYLSALGWRGSFVLCGLLALVLAVAMAWATRRPAVGDGAPAAPAATAAKADRAGVFAASFRRLNLGAWLSFLAISYVAYAFAAWGTVFLTQAGLALPAALQALLGFNLAAVIMAITTGFIVTARGSAVVMRHGSLATWVACGLMWLALQPETQAAGWQTLGVRVAAVLAGAATGAVLASLYTVLANAYPPSCRGFGIGLGMLLGRGGAIASTYTGGMLLASAGSSVTPLFLVLGGCAVLSLLGTALIDRHVLPAASRE